MRKNKNQDSLYSAVYIVSGIKRKSGGRESIGHLIIKKTDQPFFRRTKKMREKAVVIGTLFLSVTCE